MNKITIEIDEDKLNTIRRQLSFQLNIDLSNEEALQIIVDRNIKPAKTARLPNYNTGKDAVLEYINNGSSSGDALRNLGCSRSTFFRIKAKEKLKAEQS